MTSLSHTPDPEEKKPSPRQLITPTDRFLAVMQGSADLFWILSSTGKMNDISPSWISFTGQQKRHASGTGWLDAVYPIDRPPLEALLTQSTCTGQTIEHICHIRRKDGIYRLMRLHLFPVCADAETISEFVVSGRDITVEYMNDIQIHQALEISHVGLWRYNVGTQHLMATKQWKQLYGFPPESPITFEAFLAMVHPDDRARIEDVNTRALAEPGTPYDVQFRFTRPDGSLRWIISQLQYLSDIPAQSNYLIGSALDISEAKSAEEQISQILESITNAFLHINREWRITYANHQFEMFSGFNRETLLGQSLWEVRPELRGASFEQHLRTAMETQQAMDFEYFAPYRNKWFAMHIYPTKEGLALYGNDITERKHAEAALRESEARFRHFVDANLLGILVHDQEGTILEANDKFLSLIEATREDLAARSLNLEDLTLYDYQARDRQAKAELLATGTYLPFEKIYRTKGGKQVPVMVGGTLMHPDGASSSLILAFALDLTAQKEMERQTQFFLGMTGHELKTPLAALKGIFQLLQRKEQRMLSTQSDLDPEMSLFFETLSERLTGAVRQIDIQARLIDDLLDISRIQTNTLELEVQRHELISIIKRTVEDLRLTAPERTLQLALPEQTTVPVLVDADRIRQVLTNYVTNALRYSSLRFPIIIGLTLQENEARVWVRDQGPGLTAEAQRDIWLRYH